MCSGCPEVACESVLGFIHFGLLSRGMHEGVGGESLDVKRGVSGGVVSALGAFMVK
jgi:hypothetical protein